MISHGTLLLDTDMGEVVKALQVKMSKIQSKGHKSVRSRVANISEFLKTPITMEDFKNQLLVGLYEASEPFETYKLTEAEWKAVHHLKAEKYDLWDWNFGRSPKFNIQRNKRFSIGEIDLRIFVEKGLISEFKVFGDFFGRKPVADIENLLISVPYDKNGISKNLKNLAVEDYFGELTKTDFLNLIYGND